ncbi:unnamed protein product [Coregonus sp. 'balchen']|nr:unnamed protein product [Coregonus sp. 'balchen']
MSKYLRHFTTVGDDHTAHWHDEGLHEAREELGPATGQLPHRELTFRDSLKRLYSSDRFQVFHYLSLALLTFFMVELAGKLFAYRLEFFHHKFEVFDGLVVIVSFILDIVYIASEDAFDGMGLLILLRLWRVARIVNGILVSVKTRADQKVHKLKESNDHLVQQVNDLQEHNGKMEQENNKLRALLRQHAIEF